METSRWSLGLGVALLAASLAAVAILVPWLSPRSPFKRTTQEETQETIPDGTFIHSRNTGKK